MKNYFYSNEIAAAVSRLLDTHLPAQTAKNIYIGDLSVLPAPDRLADFLPAVVISADGIDPGFANESKDILNSPYSFTISYIFSYTFEGDYNAVQQGKRGAEEVANVLINFRTLDGFSIPKSESQCGGLVFHSQVGAIRFESGQDKVFRKDNTPIHIANIEYCVGFRTYAQADDKLKFAIG